MDQEKGAQAAKTPGPRRTHQSGTRGRGFGGTEVAMLILIAHTGKTVELECDGTSR